MHVDVCLKICVALMLLNNAICNRIPIIVELYVELRFQRIELARFYVGRIFACTERAEPASLRNDTSGCQRDRVYSTNAMNSDTS